jgi:hypothetical protein
MAQARGVHTFPGAPARVRERPRGRELLYKVDHPRGIDRYIDFFGDGAAAVVDPCGERLFESPACAGGWR